MLGTNLNVAVSLRGRFKTTFEMKYYHMNLQRVL